MPEPFLSVIRKQVVSITLPRKLPNQFKSVKYSILIKNPMTSKGCSTDEEKIDSLLNLTGTPFYVGFSNTLIAAGCNNTASLTNVEPSVVGCKSSCGTKNRTSSDDYFARINCYNKANQILQVCDVFSSTSCDGIGCCKASMPDGVQRVVDVKIEDSNTTTKGCKVAFLTDESYNMLGGYSPQQIHSLRYSHVELGWFIHTTSLSFIDSLGCQNLTEYNKKEFVDPTTRCVCDYNVDLRYASCSCNSGYKGNPYVGCQDIDECLGLDSYGNFKDYCERGRTCVNLQGHFECVYPKTRLIAIVIGACFGLLIFIGGIYWLYKFSRKQI